MTQPTPVSHGEDAMASGSCSVSRLVDMAEP
jgi:hypothetical protein